ncbi:homocysteine S-methyltransferase family protein [Vibrio breoganii]|uniref:homocysteine S-methyltransferase family protein n=1 Tax=Vibrio breoganii TaxID=553239 RepID=UPI000C84BA24|nr:homocysteine S-methyltransferase family protein [Vibrio breoganii]PMG83433.1 homocysteine methyltransferase [Vibrio breoganii]PMG88151.1 homocysteine methyltransferase [Vibrio breoganii]PMG93786.1 homocysteine methyltransferase [Vibrio breoganii]PMJ48517.1 homocysteine methyltransferase [Vibrio breoganii]PMK51127.1 homocysteine methyltransferase [Vibrio breoganii]
MTDVIILDGGMGRELKRIGAPFTQPQWSAQALIESPKHVEQAHRGFIEAGAEIITVNSYACVPFHLGEALYQQRGAELARTAALLAREAVNKSNQNVAVAGSIPPALGSYRPDLFEPVQVKEVTQTLFEAQEAYVDLWLAETVASIAEFEAISQVLSQTDKACHYAFTLQDDLSDIPRLRSGETVKEATLKLCKSGAAGIFFNCSIPEVMEQAIAEAKAIIDEQGIDVAIGVFANSFTPIGVTHEANDTIQSMRELSPEDYLEFAKQWHQAGATIIGGCCGIYPSHIKALAEWRDSK